MKKHRSPPAAAGTGAAFRTTTMTRANTQRATGRQDRSAEKPDEALVSGTRL